MCGADGAHSTVCLDLCSGYEAFTDEDTFAYRYYTVRMVFINNWGCCECGEGAGSNPVHIYISVAGRVCVYHMLF